MRAANSSAQHTFDKAQGAVFVETAMGILIFVIAFILLLWWALALNMRWTLQAAAWDSIRLAYSRGHDILPSSDLFKWGNGIPISAAQSTTLLKVLRSQSESGTITSPLLAITPSFDSTSPPASVDDVSPVYVAALAYAYERMRIGIGGMVKYPCDPATTPGCVRCDLLDFDDVSSTWKPLKGSAAAALPDSMKLRCSYQPDITLLRPLINLIRVLGGYGPSEPVILFTAEGSSTLPGDLGV